MEKYGVKTDKFEKTSNSSLNKGRCPDCKNPYELVGRVKRCPVCGTKPFEGVNEQYNEGKSTERPDDTSGS